MWGQVLVAYTIRLRFDGEESFQARLTDVQRELATVDRDLLRLRLAVQQGKDLANQLRGLLSAWRLARDGQLRVAAHQAQRDLLQERQLADEGKASGSKRLQQRLEAAKAQLVRLKKMARMIQSAQVWFCALRSDVANRC